MFEAIADGLGPSHWGSILAAMNDLENPDVPPDEPDRNESGPDDTIEASFLEQLRDKRAVSDEPGDDQMTGSPPKMLRTEVRASAIGLSKRASKAASVSQQHDVHSPLRRRADSAHQASHTPMSTTSTSQRGLDHSNNNLSTNNYGGSDYDELHGSSSEASPIGTLEAGQPMDPAKDHEKLYVFALHTYQGDD